LTSAKNPATLTGVSAHKQVILMTPDQEKQMTMLVLKFGSIEEVLNKYCNLTGKINYDEFGAIEAWIKSPAGEPYRKGVANGIASYGNWSY